jgi:methylenetetrahydrofolate dehydrogenase (NADP+) / methenyltetrahydrofolate cyclohydrolase
MGTVLDGKAHSKRVIGGLRPAVAELARQGVTPSLHVILVGEDTASQVYVRNKARRAEKLGLRSEVARLPEGTGAEELLERIALLNEDEETDGILVQLPIPGVQSRPIIDAVAADKDVDGFHPTNAGLLSQRRPRFVPCTPLGVVSLLDFHEVELSGKQSLVVGRSDIVGRPMASMLTHRNATVTVAHSRTRHLDELVAQAEVLVVAMGHMHAIDAGWVREGAVVVDVGMHRKDDGKLTGDVNPDGLAERAAAYTPVPGGVGPMTIAMLMVNTCAAAAWRRGLEVSELDALVPKV